jgi:hypothetical protein
MCNKGSEQNLDKRWDSISILRSGMQIRPTIWFLQLEVAKATKHCSELFTVILRELLVCKSSVILPPVNALMFTRDDVADRRLPLCVNYGTGYFLHLVLEYVLGVGRYVTGNLYVSEAITDYPFDINWNCLVPWDCTQSVPRGKVSMLGGHSVGNSKQKSVSTCVLLRTVSERAISLYRRATRHVLTRVAKCIAVDGGIFGNVLH